MVRYINARIEIYEEVSETDDAGDVITEFSKVGEVAGDVQPHTLTEDEIKAFGLSTVKGNVRLFLYNGFFENIKAGNRAKVISDLSHSEEWFNIMPINAWTKHGECLLVPVENEDWEEPTPPEPPSPEPTDTEPTEPEPNEEEGD